MSETKNEAYTKDQVDTLALALVNVDGKRLDLPPLNSVTEFRFDSEYQYYCDQARAALDAMGVTAAPPPEPPLPWLALDLALIFQWALSKVDQDVPDDKPKMPAHDYALQWALDTASGPSIGPLFPWGERNLSRCYRDYHAQIATLTAQLAEARAQLTIASDHVAAVGKMVAQPQPAPDVVRVRWVDVTAGDIQERVLYFGNAQVGCIRRILYDQWRTYAGKREFGKFEGEYAAKAALLAALNGG